MKSEIIKVGDEDFSIDELGKMDKERLKKLSDESRKIQEKMFYIENMKNFIYNFEQKYPDLLGLSSDNLKQKMNDLVEEQMVFEKEGGETKDDNKEQTQRKIILEQIKTEYGLYLQYKEELLKLEK